MTREEPKIKIGIKIYSTNLNYLEDVNRLFEHKKIDYVEIYIVPQSFNNSISALKALKPPIILHAPHEGDNFNIADKDLLESNIKIFEEVKKFAKGLNALKVIVHAGNYKENKKDSINIALNCLNKFKHKEILIENMPYIGKGDEKFIGYCVNDIKTFINHGYGFCLDLSHAYKCYCNYKSHIKLKDFIKELASLNPYMFHICDGHINIRTDEHLNLLDGDFDIDFLKKIIENNDSKLVIFETPKVNGLEQDLKNIKVFKNGMGRT